MTGEFMLDGVCYRPVDVAVETCDGCAFDGWREDSEIARLCHSAPYCGALRQTPCIFVEVGK